MSYFQIFDKFHLPVEMPFNAAGNAQYRIENYLDEQFPEYAPHYYIEMGPITSKKESDPASFYRTELRVLLSHHDNDVNKLIHDVAKMMDERQRAYDTLVDKFKPDIDGRRYRTLMKNFKSDHIWYHVFFPEDRQLGDGVSEVLDAIYERDNS
jgi:hypothetical protein